MVSELFFDVLAVASSPRFGFCASADAGTVDLFTEVSRGVDKQLWFLEAHVQEPTGGTRDGDHAGKR